MWVLWSGRQVYGLMLTLFYPQISGRRRFNIISPSLEERLGKSTVDQVKQEYQGRFLSEYDPRVKQVKKVLARLLPYAQSSGLEAMDWEVHVIDSPEQNAFVAPGYVYTRCWGLDVGADL
jgi:predicted Zn-dependent protease